MNTILFTRYFEKPKPPFERLLDIFLELLLITSGDVDETLKWMRDLDQQYRITDDSYTLDDFFNELRDKGYIRDQPSEQGPRPALTAKTEQQFRQRALEQVFGKLRKSSPGQHRTSHSGKGEETNGDTRAYEFGDGFEMLAVSDSFRNAQVNRGSDDFTLREEDLEVYDTEYKTQTATVLLIDISHSMILYGEDRITPAKKVAMALAEMIRRKYKGDTLDIVAFGNDAHLIGVKDLPYLKVGPFHTNTVAGLEMAMEILRKKKTPNKQIFMITDGKPTCIREGGRYYKNSFGLDPKIINKTLNLAKECRKLKIPVTTFMIASDPYLKEFVEEFTEVNNGKAFYSTLNGLGDLVFEDFEKNKRKRS